MVHGTRQPLGSPTPPRAVRWGHPTSPSGKNTGSSTALRWVCCLFVLVGSTLGLIAQGSHQDTHRELGVQLTLCGHPRYLEPGSIPFLPQWDGCPLPGEGQQL